MSEREAANGAREGRLAVMGRGEAAASDGQTRRVPSPGPVRKMWTDSKKAGKQLAHNHR